MNTVRMSEKIGAMGLVDELRRQQMEVQEHLDLPKRRSEIAASIREYYQHHNIDYDDELIEQGVHEFFSQRLVFEPAELGMFDRLLCHWLLKRDKPVGISAPDNQPPKRIRQTTDKRLLAVRLLRVLVFLVIPLSITKCVFDLIDQDVAGKLYNDLFLERDLLSKLQESAATSPAASFDRQLPATLALIAQTNNLLGLAPDASMNKDDLKHLQETLPDDERKVEQVKALLLQIKQQRLEYQALIESSQRLQAIVNWPAYEKAAWQFAEISKQTEIARQALDTADNQGLPMAQQQIAKLAEMLNETERLQATIKQQAVLDRRLRQLPLVANDARQLKEQSTRVTHAVEAFSADNANQQLGTLQSLLQFAEQPLSLDIVDEDGVRPAIERCDIEAACDLDDESSQGKRWYAIVEARDASGNLVHMVMPNTQNGEPHLHRSIGVRISRGEYLKIKEDRLSDGLIDNRLMGNKPPNSLSVKFNNRAIKNADLIKQW